MMVRVKNFLKNNSFYLLIGLSIVGIYDTSYLIYSEFFNQGECRFLGGTCGEVLNSEYARIATIPLSVWGLILYLTLFFLSVKSHFENRSYLLGIFLLSLIGSIFSWYFFYLQAKVIEAWCSFCLVSFGINNFIFLYMVLLHFLHEKNERLPIRANILFNSFKILLWNGLFILLIFKLTEDYLKTGPEIEDLSLIIGIIENDYIEIKDIDPFIEEYVFLEKRRISNVRKKALELKLIEKAAEKANLGLGAYLIKEKVIAKPTKLEDFLESYYATSNETTEKLIEKLKKEFFYREIIY